MNTGSIFNATNDLVYGGICATASLSVMGCLAIILSYRTFKELRRHPYSIVYRIAVSDMVSSVFLLIVYALAYVNMQKGIPVPTVMFFILWLLVSIGEFGSFCFHGLLSISLLINSIAPFSDGSFLQVFFIPIYIFCSLYPTARVTLWRLIHYGSIEIDRKSELPWEGAIGISLAFLLNITALLMALFSVSSLTKILYQTKRAIIIQMALYLICFVIRYSGPLAFRIEYLIDKSAASPDNILCIWSELSALIIGFVNSCVWMSMPIVRSAIKRKFLSRLNGYAREDERLVSQQKADGDLGQLSRLLRKNILFSTVKGIRSVVALYSNSLSKAKTSSKKKDKLLDIDDDEDFLLTYINMQHDDQYKDDELLLGSNISFFSLAPKPFLNICKMSGFSDSYLLNILQPSQFLADAIKNQKFSEGKSGSFFVFSPDKRLIIKTIPKHEFESMQRLIMDYYHHLEQNPESLLIRILGVYSMRLIHTKVYVVFMANLFTMPIGEKYDLKGSWVARTAEPSSSVKKDCDLTTDVFVGATTADQLISQITADVNLLSKHNIMDYSLLLGIRNREKASSKISLPELPPPELIEEDLDIIINTPDVSLKNALPNTIFPSTDGTLEYVVSIIDILQNYNLDKKAERFFKVYFQCKDRKGLSVQEPDVYRDRFVERMRNLFK